MTLPADNKQPGDPGHTTDHNAIVDEILAHEALAHLTLGSTSTGETFGCSGAGGSATTAAKTDHRHAMPANPVTAHVAESDPHTQYQRESEKGAASGYAPLDANSHVPTTNLGSGTASSSTYLRGDQTWATISGGGGSGLNWRGEWSSQTQYAIDDAVAHDGSSYIAIAANTNSEPPSDNWNLMASAGATGATGDAGAAGAAGKTVQSFRQDGIAHVATGTEGFPLPFNANIDTVRASSMVAPYSTAVVVDVKANGTSLWANPDNRPRVPTGQLIGSAVAPDTAYRAAGTLLTADIVSVGPESGGGGSCEYHGVSSVVNSGSSTLSSFNIPIPTTYSAGDLLLLFVANEIGTVSSLPSGWSYLEPVVVDTNASVHLYTAAKIASASESGTQTVTMSQATRVVAVTLSILNPAAMGQQPDDTGTSVQSTATTSTTTPDTDGIDTTGDNRLGVWAYVARFTGGAYGNITLPGALTSRCNAYNTTTGANLCLAVGTEPMASQGNYSALTASTSVTTRWAARALAIKPGSSGHSPGENVTVHVCYHEAS